MLIENMAMAFSAIRANKMRSFLTMLGIIIGIGSVISIVSIGDTMRGLFSDLYKNVGITQAYLAIGYWVDDVRQSDYFTLENKDICLPCFDCFAIEEVEDCECCQFLLLKQGVYGQSPNHNCQEFHKTHILWYHHKRLFSKHQDFYP